MRIPAPLLVCSSLPIVQLKQSGTDAQAWSRNFYEALPLTCLLDLAQELCVSCTIKKENSKLATATVSCEISEIDKCSLVWYVHIV